MNNIGPRRADMSTSKRTRQQQRRKRVRVFYDDDPSEGDVYCDVTVSQSSSGRVFRSTTRVSEREAGMTSDSTDPWTGGFFDENSEAFVVDSLPDDFQDFDTPALQPDSDEDENISVRPKVLTVFTTACSLTDEKRGRLTSRILEVARSLSISR
jgi:hypothetical protein